jgi:hypothetical protein
MFGKSVMPDVDGDYHAYERVYGVMVRLCCPSLGLAEGARELVTLVPRAKGDRICPYYGTWLSEHFKKQCMSNRIINVRQEACTHPGVKQPRAYIRAAPPCAAAFANCPTFGKPMELGTPSNCQLVSHAYTDGVPPTNEWFAYLEATRDMEPGDTCWATYAFSADKEWAAEDYNGDVEECTCRSCARYSER